MILSASDESSAGRAAPGDGRATLDDLFRRVVAARPDALALVDPPDRASFTDGAPRSLPWAEADRIVSAIANLLRSLGLSPGAIVAVQLPNVIESVVTLLGVLRAGLIAAPLPLLWRQAEACAALGRVSARALVSCRRVGEVDHADLAMHVAAETFAIRFVCAFGNPVPDGIIPLDEVFGLLPASPPPLDRSGSAAARTGIVTFDMTTDGLVPVARSHGELIAAGEAVAAAAELPPGATLLGSLMTSSFAGLATTIVPWLLAGGTLRLHQPAEPATLLGQRWDAAVLPGPLLGRLVEAGLLHPFAPQTVLAVWRAPERMPAVVARHGDAGIVDVPVFGEVGLLALPRGSDEAPPQFPAPGDAAGGLELIRNGAGTLCLRGAMVPAHPCPPGSPRGPQFNLVVGADGFVDTRFPCHLDRATGRLVLDGPPAGIVSVGGYRFAARDLQDAVAPIDPDGAVAPLPDAIAGHRLAGVGGDRSAIHDKLIEQGASPLLSGAFRERRAGRASAA